MESSAKAPWSTGKTLLVCVLSIALAYGLVPAGVLLWAGAKDWHNAKVAREIIDPRAAAYLQQAYPGHDFIVEDAYHVFKDNCFQIDIQSRSSQDTHFCLQYDHETYELIYDSYQRVVVGGMNTRQRLEADYDARVRACLESMPGLLYLNTGFCSYRASETGSLQFSPNGLSSDSLEVDGVYDVCLLGEQYGYLSLTFVDSKDHISLPGVYERMLEVHRLLTGGGVGYYVLDVTIANGAYPDNTVEFHIYDVTKQDLFCDEPLLRLQELWDAQEANRQALREKWAHSGKDAS